MPFRQRPTRFRPVPTVFFGLALLLSASVALAADTSHPYPTSGPPPGSGDAQRPSASEPFGPRAATGLTALDDEMLVLAKSAAAESARSLEMAIDRGLKSEDDIFSTLYFPIMPLTSPPTFSTTYDDFVDVAIKPIEDLYQAKNPAISFAVLVDVNGYLPSHNSRFNQRLTGDFVHDRDGNRTKRLFDDEVGLNASRNVSQPLLKQVYRRDTDEVMWDISSPVYVKGRHWGAFRIGLSMDKASQAIADLRWKMIASMASLLMVLVLAINLITRFVMRPLRLLRSAVGRMEGGDLGEEEIGRLRETRGQDEVAALSRVFAVMASQVKARETKLRQQVEELRIEIDHTKRAKQVAEITETDYFQSLRKKAQELRGDASVPGREKT